MKRIESNIFYKITYDRLCNWNGWWRIEDNFNQEEVYTCREAVQKRDRLGAANNGIPLWVELKSQIIISTNIFNKSVKYIVVHTRANTKFDEESILKVLHIDSKNVALNKFINKNHIVTPKFRQRDSDIFGLVNPLNIDKIILSQSKKCDISEIYQVFDNSIFKHGGHPNTMITNAGDRKKYMEIYPNDLLKCVKSYFPNTFVGDISIEDPVWLDLGNVKYKKQEWLRFAPPCGPKIGILTGNSPESGITLWNDIICLYRTLYNNLTDILMPEIIIHSLPQMGLSMELVSREKYIWNGMKKAIKKLLDADCKLITIACNTTIYFESKIDQMCKPYNARFVSIAKACLPEILKHNYNTMNGGKLEIGFIGIGSVIDIQSKYSGYKKQFEENNISTIVYDATDLAYLIKKNGLNKPEKILNKFRNIISNNFKGINIILLSLTEVCLVYRMHKERKSNKFKSNKIFIDPIILLSRYLVFLYIYYGLRDSHVCQIPKDFDLKEKIKEFISYG